ncbi:hypothetical protein HOY82DRAFT_598768 [Tuber indicum]|nr:hypothetical protein HOY82DRAFT_598768 [Tuber indicum]
MGVSMDLETNPPLSICLEPDILDPQPRSGHPRLLTCQEEDQIVATVRQGFDTRRMCLDDLCITAGLSKAVSPSTVLRVLHKHGIKQYRENEKFILDYDDCVIWREFCEQYYTSRPEVEWANWGFTDEMSIVIGDTYGPSYVWRSKDEKWHEDCMGTIKKNVGTSVMCWGMIGWNYKGPFYVWEEESEQEKKEAEEEMNFINSIIMEEQERATTEWKASEDYATLKEQEL